MTGTAAEPPADPASLEDHAYFSAVEERFLHLRGKATLLSAADWQVARSWHRAGIPIALVVRVMEELFARTRERRKRTISSLSYFKAAVEAAWEEIAVLSAAGRRERLEPFGLEERLARLATGLPDGLPQRERWAEAIAGLGGEVEAVERALEELDRAMIAALKDAIAPAAALALEAAAEKAIASLAGRLPADELDQARERLRRRLLRERFSAPVLSLFAPEARGNGAASAI